MTNIRETIKIERKARKKIRNSNCTISQAIYFAHFSGTRKKEDQMFNHFDGDKQINYSKGK